MEGVLDDEADYLRREVGEMRGELCGEGVEVVALVAAEAARGDHSLDTPDGRESVFRGVRDVRDMQSLCLSKIAKARRPRLAPGGLFLKKW